MVNVAMFLFALLYVPIPKEASWKPAEFISEFFTATPWTLGLGVIVIVGLFSSGIIFIISSFRNQQPNSKTP